MRAGTASTDPIEPSSFATRRRMDGSLTPNFLISFSILCSSVGSVQPIEIIEINI